MNLDSTNVTSTNNNINIEQRENEQEHATTVSTTMNFRNVLVSTAHEGPMDGTILQHLPFPTTLPYTIRRSVYYQHMKGKHGTGTDDNTIVVLGIEGSANKIGIGIIQYSYTTQQYTILSNPRKTYIPTTGTGFIPKDTAIHHQNYILPLIRTALYEAFPPTDTINTTIDYSDPKNNIAAIAYTKGPGMGKPLQSCAIVARTLSTIYNNCPIIGVNHCVGHIEMGRLCCSTINPIILYVSGGNTQILAYVPQLQQYTIFGETIDIAIGNCLDRFARIIHLSNDPSPGYNIEQMASSYAKVYESYNQVPPLIIDVPYTVKGMDVSFSGILSYIEQVVKDHNNDCNSNSDIIIVNEQDNVTTTKQAAWCYALQETIFSMLVEITERAISHIMISPSTISETNSTTATATTAADTITSPIVDVLIVGGVGCNVRLQTMMQQMINDRGSKQQQHYTAGSSDSSTMNNNVPSNSNTSTSSGGKVCGMDHRYCIDNGAMIALVGLLSLQYGHVTKMVDTWCTQRYRTDQMSIVWRPNKQKK